MADLTKTHGALDYAAQRLSDRMLWLFLTGRLGAHLAAAAIEVA